MRNKGFWLIQKVTLPCLLFYLNTASAQRFEKPITIEDLKPVEAPNIANTEPVNILEVEKAIETSKKYQGEVACGKIDFQGNRYIFRIPSTYQWLFSMEYDIQRQKGENSKQKDACQNDIRTTVVSFLWPSMAAYYGKSDYSILDTNLKIRPNKITVALTPFQFTMPNPQDSWIERGYIDLLKDSIFGYIPYKQKAEDAQILAVGSYLADLDLYHYTRDGYRYDPPSRYGSQSFADRKREKWEIFWSLDSNKRVRDIIECRYEDGFKNIDNIFFKDTICNHMTNNYPPIPGALEIRYASSYIRDWKHIRHAAVLQYQAFMTKETLP